MVRIKNKERRKLVKKAVAEIGHRRKKAMKKSIVGFIPARKGSKGILHKNTQMVAGYPLIAHSILILKAAGIDRVWVSTDSNKIAEIAQKYGARVLMRPSYLASDDSTTEDAISHFLRNVSCNVVVFLQCTSPILTAVSVEKGMHKFFACALDSVFSAVPIIDTLIWDAALQPWNYNPKHRGRRQVRKISGYVETGGFYIFKKEVFKKYKCRICGRYDVSEVPFWQSFQIDNKQDLQFVRKHMKKEN